ncbi:MAG: ATP-binding cassette domain-containing protein [Bacilli bacterium]
MDIIKITDLDFKYNDKVIFDKLNLTIEEHKWYTLIGNNGSGKSTLVKLMLGLIPTNNIIIDNLLLSKNIFETRKKIGVVFEIPDNNLVCETVKEELAFSLENIGTDVSKIDEQIKYITQKINIKNLIGKTINELNNLEKQKVALASSLMTNPKILILDEAFTYLDNQEKDSMLSILKNLNITIINITHDIEESLYGDNIIILNDGKIIRNNKKELIYQEEKLLNSIGINLPFIVELSNKLHYYGMLDKTVFSIKEMVNIIWK